MYATIKPQVSYNLLCEKEAGPNAFCYCAPPQIWKAPISELKNNEHIRKRDASGH